MTIENARSGPPETSPFIVLLTLAHRIESELGAALAPLGLTVSRFGLLGHITGVPGASFSDLARMSGITVQSVHTAVSFSALKGTELAAPRHTWQIRFRPRRRQRDTLPGDRY
ncbi:MarR family transcriptional regulator [Streptosporangium sp. CA-115845]|uniref:MarR family transcriptional regulator n=1 Tax=Streptosporangium sp. CA-115845 TaxID=3240071 RepID=UPI003D8FDD82